jgi:tetratricopeptide (TPR) repeat protein
MDSILVFMIVFGGTGFLIFLFFTFRTMVSPKKIMAIAKTLESGNTKGAMRQAKMLLAKNARNPDAHWLLGECYRLENRPDLAIAEYKHITNLGKFTPLATERKVRSRLAEQYRVSGMVDEAQKEYILLSKLEPDNHEHYYQIAQMFEERNYTDSALTNYKKAVSINPNHAPSQFRMGVIFHRKQLVNEAKKALLTALRLDSQLHACHYYLGKICKAAGDSAAAQLHFAKATKDPDLKQRALLERANLFITRNDIPHAQADLQRALALGETELPVVMAVRYLLAKTYEINKDLVKAVEQWEWVYNKNPKFHDVAAKLALYSDVRADDRLKEFLTASQNDFKQFCTQLVQKLGLSIQDVFLKNQDLIEVNALETQSKWRNAKKAPSLIRVFRSAEPVSYDAIRGLYDQMRKLNATRSICIAASTFTRSAVEFAQIRPIDLIDKDELVKLLHQLQ